MRRLGTSVFAAAISLLTGAHIADSSFGLRAIRAEVAGAVPLEQPQYQSSELLIAVLALGFRVVEVPATIHERQVGESKKGRDAIYGLHYAGVVGGAWLRGAAPPRPGQPGGRRPASRAPAAGPDTPPSRETSPRGPAEGQEIPAGPRARPGFFQFCYVRT